MQLTRGIHRLASRDGQRRATTHGARVRTWSEVTQRIARFAGGLRALGVTPGDRVGILSLNSDNYLETIFGILWAGGCLVPLNTRWSVQENTYALNNSDTRMLVIDDHFVEAAAALQQQVSGLAQVIHAGKSIKPAGWLGYEQLIADNAACEDARRGGEDLAGIFYTGGTTGLPKGVMVPHRGLLSSSQSLIMPCAFDDDCVLLHVAPMFHMADASQTFAAIMVGASHVFLEEFQPERVLATIGQEGVTHVTVVPTLLKLLIEHPSWHQYDLSSLKRISYGGAAITESLLETALERLPRCEFVQVYGQTELSPVATILEPKYHTLSGPYSGHLKSVGRATTATEVEIIDAEGKRVAAGVVGEIAVSGAVTMLGYWNLAEETANTLKNGQVSTGDAGYLDKDGFLHIVDRIKDMIISGGENVYSAEVENALAKHAQVSGSVVFGMPDAHWGEKVVATVILRPEAEVTAEELIEHCRKLIAHYKCPRAIYFRTEPFPVSGAGKLLKRLVRQEYIAKAEVR